MNLTIRTQQSYTEHYDSVLRKTDKIFGYLFLFQWLMGILFALIISPKVWTGSMSQVHGHVYAAIFLGGLLAAYPVYLTFFHAGRKSNRYIVAVAQIMFSILYIHLMGGRIETHFHVFGSLAFLALYRDWKVLALATVLTASDHVLRGFWWPESIYGVLYAAPWRAFEHSAWVLFEDFILFFSVQQGQRELWSIAEKRVQLEDTLQTVESQVIERTKQVRESHLFVNLLQKVAVAANAAKSAEEVLEKTLHIVSESLDFQVAHAYFKDPYLDDDSGYNVWFGRDSLPLNQFKLEIHEIVKQHGADFPVKILEGKSEVNLVDLSLGNPVVWKAAQPLGLKHVVAIPVVIDGKIVCAMGFFVKKAIVAQAALIETLSNVGIQVGCVLERVQIRSQMLRRTWELQETQKVVLDQEQALVVSAKFSSLGEMAGGIAHEINNPVATIKSLSSELNEIVLEEPLDKALILKVAETITKTTDRIAKIVSGLRSFSRDGSRDPVKSVHVHHLVEETLSFCTERLQNHGTELRLSPISQELCFEGRETEISQVLLNLLNNAQDAIAHMDKRWIAISAAENNGWIEIRVTDCGAGIPREIRDKLFQPFFTTKEIGKGTGLGLSISFGILRSHLGELKIDDTCPNTCFLIRLRTAGQTGAVKKVA